MDDEQRGYQMAAYFIFLGIMGWSLRHVMPTFEYGLDHFLQLQSWYGIVLSFPLIFLMFMIWMGFICFFFSLDSLETDEE